VNLAPEIADPDGVASAMQRAVDPRRHRPVAGTHYGRPVQPDPDVAPKRVTAIANPTHDRAFVALVDRLLAEGVSDPEALETTLRMQYPEATVRERELTGEPVRVWYAYRDGRWVDSRDEKAL
jgi:hypothetical protein